MHLMRNLSKQYRTLEKFVASAFASLPTLVSNSNITSSQFEKNAAKNGQITDEFSMMLDAIKNRELERDNAITALRESEKRFKTIVANIPGIVYRYAYDKELTTMYISIGLEKLTGFPPSDFIGNKFRKFTDIIHRADRGWFDTVIQQSIAQRKPYVLEYRILTTDEEFIWVHDEGQGLFDRNTDELLYVDGVIFDITEQKNAEKAVKESEERYKLLSNITIEAIIVHNHGSVIDANLSFCHMFGYEIEEVLSKNIIDFIVDDDYKALLYENIINYNTSPYEIIAKRKDGTKLWVENVCKPFIYHGKEATVMALRDISEYKKSKQALKVSEQRYHLLFENMTTAFALHEIICDKEGKPVDYRYLEINPAFEKYTTLKASDTIGKTVREVLPGIEQYWIDNYGKVALTGEAIAFENYAGELGKYYSTWAFSPQKGQFAVIFTDVTERKLLEIELQKHKESLEDLVKERTKELDKARLAALNLAQDANMEKLKTENALTTLKKRESELHKTQIELKEALTSTESASRAKSDFISQISHELRTPLNAIIGYCQILKTYDNITEEQLRYIGTIRASGDILLSLINDILDFGKIEANEMEVVNKEFDLKMLIEQIFDINKIKAEEKDLLFTYEESQIPQFVRGDERKLKQILLNLLSNAIKYTNSGSILFKISHRTNNNQDLFKFIIQDTGVGIAQEHLQTIFEPFKQVGEQSKFVQGTGLGLAITQKIINLLKGELTVDSAPGKGSIFSVELGLKRLDKKAIPNLKKEIAISGYQGERKKILVVDDNITNVSVLHEFLKNLGFIMYTAKNGHEAIETTLKSFPDLILIDLIMPVMDGLEAIQILRKNKSISNVKIIGLSASLIDPDHKNKFISLCDSFLNKPVDFSELLEKIQQLLLLEWLSLKMDYIQKPELDPEIFETPDKMLINEFLKLAEEGNFHKIEELTNNLLKENDSLIIFCKTVLKFCQTFDDEKLTKFILPFK